MTPANASHVPPPPPDRPETMTRDDLRSVEAAIEYTFGEKGVPRLRARILATYARCAALEAENARLKELADVVEAWYNGDDTSLAEAWVTYRNAARSGRKEAERG